ncbi:MAG: F0F1 ATP synthase subunit C [Candidatus Hydrogenedentes bacterium]|nr:F0F1 ATP synthase subunit C [Candidatus Hydrogenedentota bacterium]
MGYAQEEHAGDAVTAAQDMSLGAGLRAAGVAIGAGLAVLGGALGTGRAQAAIGAGGTGALAEKPELFGRIFILVALPETVIVLGFVVGVLLWTSL